MAQEDKELVIIDLSARLNYGLRIQLTGSKTICSLLGIRHNEIYTNVDSEPFDVDFVKPYLRPMSSMTEEECKEAKTNGCIIYHDTSPKNRGLMVIASPKGIDWLNKHYFDYRGLIEKGLALEAPEGMYDTKIQ